MSIQEKINDTAADIKNGNLSPDWVAVDSKDILAIAAAFRALEQENILLKQGCENNPLVHEMIDWRERAESAEAKLTKSESALDTWRKESAYNLQGKNDVKEYARDLEVTLTELNNQKPIGRVDRGQVSDSNEYPDAHVVCLHEHVGWEAFQDGTELFLRPALAINLAELVPEERSYAHYIDSSTFMTMDEALRMATEWNACRAAMLRNIEEAQ